MNVSCIKKAWVYSLPIMVGYVFLGFGFGLLLRQAGYGLAWAICMSVLIYGGTIQYVGVSLISAPASLLTCALTTLMINARHIFYSISMIPKYKNAKGYKPYLMFALTDETYALLSDMDEDTPPQFYFFVSLFNQSYWIVGSALGSLLATALPFDMSGISFSMTALFVSAYTEQFLSGKSKVSALIGLITTFVFLLLLGKDIFLIPSMICIILLLLLLRKKVE